MKPVSKACLDGRHSECTETLDTCNCTYRGLHRTMHRYATIPPPKTEPTKPTPSESRPSSFAEMEVAATVALDGDTRRSCNNEDCILDYGHEGKCCPDGDTIDDGFGSVWSAWCPECGKKSMAVMRPGKVQCGNCG